MKVSDQELVTALITSPTNKQAASVVGLSERQLQERIRGRDFKKLYVEVTNDIMQRAADGVRTRLVDAVETLAEIMKNADEDSKTRISAATAILQNADRIIAMSRSAQHVEDEANDPFAFDVLARCLYEDAAI